MVQKTLFALLFLPAFAQCGDDFATAVAPFFEQHCNRCHGEKKKKGSLRLDELSRDFTLGPDVELWHEVITRMGAGEMPPEDEPQPSAAEAQAVMDWLADSIKAGKEARMAKRARVAHYRLSREEYANTVYDLLGVTFDPEAPGAFTPDPQWHGFERIGSELALSPSHIEKYLKAAREIVDRAWPEKPPREIKSHRRAIDIDWNNREKEKWIEDLGILDQVRTEIWPGHTLSYLRPHGGHGHDSGVYKVRIKLSGVTPPGARPPHLSLFSKKLDRIIYEADVLAPEDEPVILEFETFFPSGQNDVKITNVAPGPKNSGGGTGQPGEFVFTTLDDPKSRAPWQRKLTDDDGNPLYPLLIFDWIEWEGPITEPEDQKKRDRFAPPPEEEIALSKLKAFAEAAWRRPVSDQETARYRKIVEDYDYKTGLVAILASKNFFYISEGEPNVNRPTVNNYELASRLSYFLWGTMPDSTLFSLAADGTLAEKDVLRKQIDRMLSDPKSETFAESFPHQWLQLSKVGEFPPDEKLYPDYDQWLEKSMVMESLRYFAEVYQNNLSIDNFLNSNWTMLNPRLADHYGLPIPKTADFERVTLAPEANRGGLLTQASILSLTSDGTRHRPVHRGVWLSETIFGKTPPPPPPNVDAIEPNPVDKPKATIREKLAAHIADENCAGCHAKIDPLGLAFDNYDAIGRWRTEEEVPNGIGKNPPVDASGSLPDGTAFSNAREFKEILLSDRDRFARAFVEKLANYALRRAMTVDDEAQLSAITTRAKANNYRLRDVMTELVVSELFMKR
ncbi:MAG: DUF1592 domain-containing protein [Verrucomicrobiales bacterium]|nr:DUF1592 domain-containing protein [Verrucomicrobiales bacterium]